MRGTLTERLGRAARGANARLRTRREDRSRLRPALLQLESRQLLSTFLVDKPTDSDAHGTLRWAINQANASPGDDKIQFAPLFDKPQTIKLSSGRDLDFNNTSGGNQKITIEGPAEGVTIQGSGTARVMTFESNANVILNRLTIKGGR